MTVPIKPDMASLRVFLVYRHVRIGSSDKSDLSDVYILVILPVSQRAVATAPGHRH